MQIQFVSDERAKRISKAIKRALAELGHDLPYSRVREATAVMYGYRNWNDLLGQAGKYVPSPYDHEVGDEEAASRRSMYVDRLGKALGIPPEVAAAVVDEVGPTSRKGRVAAADWNWTGAMGRMASSLSRRMVSIEPAGVGQCDGFLIQLEGGNHPDRFVLAVAKDGSEVVFGNGRKSIRSTHDRGLHDANFGRMLQKAGLLAETGDIGNVPPHPLVLETLRRLSDDALSLLRTVPAFSPRAYEIAYDIPDAAPFRQLVTELPMLGAEIQSLAHSDMRDNGRRRDRDDRREAMIGSTDPMDHYLGIVEDFVDQAWPDLMPLDRAAAERAVRAVGKVVVLEDLGLLPWHVAFLSHAPEGCLPGTPEQMAACMMFTERWTVLFKPMIGMMPADFYREFARDLGGNWAALRGREHASRLSSSVALEVGDAVGRRLALDLGFHHDEIADNEASAEIGLRLMPMIAEGRGFVALGEVVGRWYDGSPDRDDADPQVWVAREFESLSTSGLLPEGLRSLSAAELLDRIGLDLTDVIDPEEGLMVDKCLFHSVTIRDIEFRGVMSADGPCIVAAVDGLDSGVALGDAAVICEVEDESGEARWWVCKYGPDERLIPLRGFGEGDVEALAEAFGIESVDGRWRKGRRFTNSSAWDALKVWVRHRPEMAEEHAGFDDYVPGWHARAVAENAGTAPARGG